MKNTHSLVQLIGTELRLGSDKPAEALIVTVSAIDSFSKIVGLLVTPVKSPCSTIVLQLPTSNQASADKIQPDRLARTVVVVRSFSCSYS
ncbi:MAG TPA: hypothetical protein VNH83_10285, partial [Bryobacteraceae bacterium]|nr:hypothetical protein [Bryobacteraceae bacterium]